ncbi:MAG TPA: hypothetical protein VF665_09515 [Longimicrobium sp.]|jgi:hypothetical protein|uniref:hypothetical protein n=1 Tax=Longimicrobium sp. TaxID=2029185 RepID=UPI002EDB92E0
MAYREFTDSDGVFWQVWETRPGDTANVRAPFAAGWLTFESPAGRLRLRPIPDAWADAPDERLGDWLLQAAQSAPAPQVDSPSPSEKRAADAQEAATASATAASVAAARVAAAQREAAAVKPASPADLLEALPAPEAALLARTRAAVARAREVIRTIGGTVRDDD